MRIVFLDIEGVLRTWPSTDLENHPDLEWNPASIANLNRVTDQTGAKIVVSSDWRLHTPLVKIQEILKGQGVTGEIIGTTKENKFRALTAFSESPLEKERTLEIRQWMIDNSRTSVVAFDDLRLGKAGEI